MSESNLDFNYNLLKNIKKWELETKKIPKNEVYSLHTLRYALELNGLQVVGRVERLDGLPKSR